MLTATGCPVGDHINVGVMGDRRDPENGGGATVGTGNDRVIGPTWSFRFKFPAAEIGSARVVASCEDPKTGRWFDFAPVAVNVRTNRYLEVGPSTTVAAGTTMTVRSVGPGCDDLSSAVVALRGPTIVYPAQTLTGNTHAQWQATFALPANLRPGAYVLYADCVYSRSTTATYTPVTITVHAPNH